MNKLYALLKDTGYLPFVRLDFSVVNDRKYYNGIVFKGFVADVAEGVLSGGQYDLLMRRMGRNAGAIGFAVYVDLLESVNRRAKAEFDVDALVLYDDDTPLANVAERVKTIQGEGKSVRAQKSETGLRFGELVDLRK